MEFLDQGGDVQRVGAITQEPGRDTPQCVHGLQQHARLRTGRRHIVQCFYLVPQAAQLEDLARDRIGAHDGRHVLPGPDLHLIDKARPGAVDDGIGEASGYDFAAQLMAFDGIRVFFANWFGEIARQIIAQDRVIGQIRFQQRVVSHDLGIGQQHRQFGSSQRQAVAVAFGQRFVVGQKFQRPVQPAGAFQRAHQPLLLVHAIDALMVGNRQ